MPDDREGREWTCCEWASHRDSEGGPVTLAVLRQVGRGPVGIIAIRGPAAATLDYGRRHRVEFTPLPRDDAMPDEAKGRRWTCIEKWPVEAVPGGVVSVATLRSDDRAGKITVKGELADAIRPAEHYRVEFTPVEG